jgi:hypothetical protein
MSRINEAVEAVMDLIDAMDNFAPITRGALGTADGLCCEIAPSTVQETYLDKSDYLPFTLALNGKHKNLETLTETMNNIIYNLKSRTEYPSGDGWQIVDISSGNIPRIIGREDNGAWLVAGDLIVKLYRKEIEA